MYIDANGGHGKVAQEDVAMLRILFHKAAAELADRVKSGVGVTLREAHALFDPHISAFLLSRWLIMSYAKTNNITPEGWLWIQVTNSTTFLAVLRQCQQLHPDDVEVALNCLQVHHLSILKPLLLFDEAQAMLKHWWFYPTETSDSKLVKKEQEALDRRPVGARFVVVAEQYFRLFVCGTNLRLNDFHHYVSAGGGLGAVRMHYSFDYLGTSSDPLESYKGVLESVYVKGGVRNLLDYFLHLEGVGDDLISDIEQSLQGRPRFTASLLTSMILRCQKDKAAGKVMLSTADLLKSCFGKYVDKQVSAEGNAGNLNVYHLWKQLWTQKPHIGDSQETVFTQARAVLLQCICNSPSETVFQTGRTIDIVHSGVAMLIHDDVSNQQVIVEPLVHSAGLTFFARNPDASFQQELLKRFFHDPHAPSPQSRGKLLELLVALNMFQDPCRLKNLQDWGTITQTVKLPEKSFLGILRGVHLTNDRVALSQFDLAAGRYIVLPDEHAGPDVLANPFIFACKYSEASSLQVVAKESRKAIRTVDPTKFYCTKSGPPTAGFYLQLHDSCQAAVQCWGPDNAVIPVRVELPRCAPTTSPIAGGSANQTVFQVDGKPLLYIRTIDGNTVGGVFDGVEGALGPRVCRQVLRVRTWGRSLGT